MSLFACDVALEKFNFNATSFYGQIEFDWWTDETRWESTMVAENDPENNGASNAYIRLSAETTDGV